MGNRAALPRPARVLLGWSAAWHALIAPVVRRDAALRDRVRLLRAACSPSAVPSLRRCDGRRARPSSALWSGCARRKGLLREQAPLQAAAVQSAS